MNFLTQLTSVARTEYGPFRNRSEDAEYKIGSNEDRINIQNFA